MWSNLRTFYSVCKMCVSVHVYRHCSLQGRYRDLLRFYQLNGSSFQCMSMKCSGFFSPVRVKRESLKRITNANLACLFQGPSSHFSFLFFVLTSSALFYKRLHGGVIANVLIIRGKPKS